MRLYKFLVAVLCIATISCAVTATAKDKKAKKMYLFGIATSFNDSTAYFTPIQEIDSVTTAGKTSILSNKQEYSLQLKNYFQNQGDIHRTCVTFNNASKSNLEKTYQQLKQKYVKKFNMTVKNIENTDFQYQRVVIVP